MRPMELLIPFFRELLFDNDSALLVVLVALGNESSELSLEEWMNWIRDNNSNNNNNP